MLWLTHRVADFEPGVWMNVPETKINPVGFPTLCRMGSIPHGTTINAQGKVPPPATKGGPDLKAVDITPFFIGSLAPLPFPTLMDVNTSDTPRLPQNLKPFVSKGTITPEILKDPITVSPQHTDTSLSTSPYDRDMTHASM